MNTNRQVHRQTGAKTDRNTDKYTDWQADKERERPVIMSWKVGWVLIGTKSPCWYRCG